MIKIFTSTQIKAIDQYTIEHEPVSSIKLMERAANAFLKQFLKDFPDKSTPKLIICGNGNNGGDGLAVARILLNKNHKVKVYIFHAEKYSPDFSKNLKRLSAKYKKQIHYINNTDFLNNIPLHTILIDAIFGTGLNTEIKTTTLQYKIIEKMNSLNFRNVVSIDIPSGMFADKHSGGIVLKASKVYTFQFPKLSFLLPENGNYLNEFTITDIKLHPAAIQKTKTDLYYLTLDAIHKRIRKRKKYSHKGTYGHALIIAGSYGKMGAAVLSARACLRSGSGLVSVHLPGCGYEIMQTAFPEAMCIIDKNEKHITSVSSDKNYDAISIGPGIGTHIATTEAVELFLKNCKQPIIADADALNILAKKKSLLKLLPENSILTPHPKEFERIAGKWSTDFERLELQQNFSKTYKVIVVLKGAHSSISNIDGTVYFNSTGNAGMATAGSGDVLTGIITGLLAQKYSPIDSAIAGVFIHGLAGDIALQNESMESLIASDIIANLGEAFKLIEK